MSNRKTDYVQCRLGRGNTVQTAWIPLAFATVGLAVRLKDGGEWEDGWRVQSTGARMPDDYIRQYNHDHGRMRQATDI